MRVTRGIAVLSLTTAAVLGLSACSSDGGEKPAPGTEQAQSAEEVAEEGSEFDLTAEDFVSRVTAASQAAGSLTMDMSTTAAGVTTDATGVVRYAGDTQEMAMSMDVPDAGAVEIRVVGGMVYMSMGELTGGKFLQIDPNDTSNPLAASFQGMMGQLDPTGAVAGLEGAIRSLEKAGEPEEKGGELAQPYTVVIDTAAAAGALPEDVAAGASLPAELTYTYWVDADDLMRGMQADVPGGGTIDATFSGWGEEVEITAPTADQITDMGM